MDRFNSINYKEVINYFKENGGVIVDTIKANFSINSARNIDEATPNEITFINSKYSDIALNKINNTKSKIILIDNDLNLKINKEDTLLIYIDNPKNKMINFINEFLINKDEKNNLSENAFIGTKVKCGKNIKIGHFAVIEDEVVLGNNVIIGHGTVIKSGTIIHDNVEIANNVTIGGFGFGFSKESEIKEWSQFPHLGRVIIKENVYIGSSTCIDRGSLSDTVIEKGTKIDNLVHIAHNVKIGENCLIIANTLIGGSTTIGDNCWVSPSASIINGIEIGENCLIGISSLVTKNIPSNSTVMGSPATDINEYKKLRSFLKKSI